MHSSKIILGVYLIKYFCAKNVFWQFLSQKVQKINHFCAVFVYFGRLGACVPSLTPSTTTPAQALPTTIVGAPSSF